MSDTPLHRWQWANLVEIIGRLQLLPDSDPRILQAINLLDLVEIEWREMVQGTPGRHAIPINPENPENPHTEFRQ